MTFIKLIRYKNLLMVLLTMVLTKYAFLHSFITSSYFSHLNFILLTISVLLITAGGYIINDIYDVESDIINKPQKTYINKKISKKTAWVYYYFSTFSGLLIGIILSYNKHQTNNICIFIFTAIGLFLYSKHLKKTVLLGNILVSTFVLLIIILINNFEHININNGQNITRHIQLKQAYSFNLNNTIYVFVIFSFLTTLIREIIKDIEDINGDIKISAKTLPILLGRQRAAKIAFYLSCLLFFILIIVLQFLNNYYLFLSYGILLIFIPLLYFLYKLWIAKSKRDFSMLSSLMKFIMFFGILSMLLFCIN